MARINIDDKLWSDPRFDALKRRMGGDEEKAAGRLLKIFRMAQEYWVTDDQLIPLSIWELYGFGDVEAVGLAERTDKGVYIKGTSDRMQWLKNKQKAGQHSAEARRSKFGTAQPSSNRPRTDSEQVFENPRTDSEPLSPSPSPSPVKEIPYSSTLVDQPTKHKKEANLNHPLFKIWNKHRGTLPKASAMSQKRTTAANARLKENSDENYWVGIVQRLAASDFCQGKSDRNWVADIDFFLKPDTHVKVLEGKYDNRSTAFKPPTLTEIPAHKDFSNPEVRRGW